jgi:hypothetical protein
MEELNKTHKEQSFGWVLTVQEMMRAVRPRQLDVPSTRQPKPQPAQPLGDLHNLAAPH